MRETDDEKKGPKVNFWLLLVISLALGGLTCWLLHFDPLPDWRNVRDPGWLMNFALGYFVLILVGWEGAIRLRRRRR